MFCKKIFLLFSIAFFWINANATVFVVTSNADSGPGTLRDALTQAAANGSAAQDIIQFNLADLSVAGRTITLVSQLPDLSANITIDGTTQPGTTFGVSDAKIAIFYNFLPPSLTQPYVFKGSNLGNFTISGLSINALSYDGQPNTFYIAIDSSSSVTISHCLMPGGNIDVHDCETFTCQSNLIGYLSDGITGFPSKINVSNVSNVVIGGDASQGNVLSGALDIEMYIPDADMTYNISNNKLGTDYTGTTSSLRLFSDGRIKVESGTYNPPSPGRQNGTISNNMIENFQGTGIIVSGFGDVVINGNAIGTDYSAKINFTLFEPWWVLDAVGSPNTAMALQAGIDATVGGSSPGDGNVIGYIKNGILEQLADQVVITHNSIFCYNQYNYNIHDLVTLAYDKLLPQVQINNISNNSISGTATPGARVELFSNAEGECQSCDPRDFFTYVTADAQGNWSYKGLLPANIVASAIYNGQTSRFTKAKVVIDNLKVTQPKCGDNTGSIEGIQFYNAGQTRWVDETGKIVSNSLNVSSLPPGRYKFKIGTDVCGAESDWIELINNAVKLDDSKIKITQPACNEPGAISGLMVSTYQNEAYTSIWTDENQKQVGNTVDISNLSNGKYALTITGKTTGCLKTYGPITIQKISGPSLDQSKINITPTNCGQFTGAITNMLVTGGVNIKYSWKNELQQEVATTKDLAGQPAGKYTLQISDDSQCGPVYSTAIEILEVNGITLNESKIQASPAGCGGNNGSIAGMQITGTTQYKWVDVNNNIVSNTANLQNAAPGDYKFVAYNNFGCSKTSSTYHIGQQQATQYPVYANISIPSCFKDNNGSVNITTDALVNKVRWVNSQGQTVGNTMPLTNAAPGIYQLYLTDINGCETLYNSYTVTERPEYIVASYGQMVYDQCGLKIGSISGVTISGGAPPYVYKWLNTSGTQIGSGNSISNLGAGTYTLNVTDTGCGNVYITYTIADESADVAPPSVSDMQLCSSGDALITVNNPSASATYRLYDSPTSTQPLDEQKSGRFKINVTGNRSFYISTLNGTCESTRAEIKVTIGVSVMNVANTFTPNGDNINDYWNIPGMQNYNQGTVQVFTRNGQKVFESRGYASPFDGTYNGKNLPVGVYYYIIDLHNSNCSILSGSLTIIR